MRAARCQPGITRGIEVIHKEGAALFDRIHGQRNISGAPANAAKRVRVHRVSFRPNQLAIGGTAPIICAAGPEKDSAEPTKRPNQLAGIAALKSSPGKLQEKPLEGFLRLRRVIWIRNSGVACQDAPIFLLSN
jgi:hypothetical protein